MTLEVVEADKMSVNSFERLNAGEKSGNALEIVRETQAPPILLPFKHKIIEIEMKEMKETKIG